VSDDASTIPSDVFFDFQTIRAATRYVLARYIAYDGCCNIKVQRLPPRKTMRQLDFFARREWYAFLERMRSAGWERVADDTRYRFMRNCPPVGAWSERMLFPCMSRLVCPYCWARRAMDLFMQLEKVVWGGFEPHAVPRQDLDLVSYVLKTPEATCRRKMCDFGLDALLQEFMFRMRLNRRAEVNRLKPVGGFVAMRIDWRTITDRKTKISTSFPQLCRGGVLLVPAGNGEKAIKALPGIEVESTPAADLTKMSLLRAVRRVCRFPRGWLSAPAETVLSYLEAMANVRTVSTMGPLRSSSKPDLRMNP
jgi:hypothetical protein